jgi:hypothetical protein
MGEKSAHRVALANRRGHRRYPAWIEVSLSDPARKTSAPATVVDLSLGGALVQSHQAVEPGTVAVISMPSGRGTITLRGTVVRNEQSWTGHLLHIEFAGTDPAARLTLCHLLDELEREFLRHQREIVALRP